MNTGLMATLTANGPRPLHPLHAILLAFALPLFLGGLISDMAYARTFHIQWSNFAAWLIAGGLFMSAFALLWALIDVILHRRAPGMRAIVYLALLAVMWTLGFFNALVHAKDAWAVMPAGLWLSVIVTLLALAASWVGYSGLRRREVR